MVRQAFLGLAAALLALMLSVRLSDGSMSFLVQSWYLPILLGSAGALMLLATVVSLQAIRTGTQWKVAAKPGTLLGAALIVAPLLLGLVLQPKALGSTSLDAAGGSAGSAARQLSAPAAAGAPAERNIYQWAYVFQSSDPKTLVGQAVDVTGFVYHGKSDPPGTFQVARFVVACCVADASGTSLLVQFAGSAALFNDRWVHVAGHIATGPDGAALVQATTVDPVEAPSNPYIYP